MNAHVTRPGQELPANLGSVFTREWVVDFILDLAGYTTDADLTSRLVVEPAVGHGAFVTRIVARLLARADALGVPPRDLGGCLRGYDIDPHAVKACRERVAAVLEQAGVNRQDGAYLLGTWLQTHDFLDHAAQTRMRADWVIGNPPYVRIEDLDPNAATRYRRNWKTMSGRADLYVAFLEAGLGMLKPQGTLAVICADRWMRNQYGRRLRAMIEQSYSLDACVVMHEVDAFEDRVAAYPAVVAVRRGPQGPTLVCEASRRFGPAAARELLDLRGHDSDGRNTHTYSAAILPTWFHDVPSWPSGTPEQMTFLKHHEATLPTLEATGVRIGVGIATGADDVYVTSDAAGVEQARLVPAITAKEIASGSIRWRGRHLVNPWEGDHVVDAGTYPGFDSYVEAHRERLQARHIAGKHPERWWRTIDKVAADLAGTPKLLIPDLKYRVFPVLDEGRYYPGHSLYWLTSGTWDLEVLGGLLMSASANAFVEAYSVRMANGYLRVSAQYLRRIRVPRYEHIPPDDRAKLKSAFRERDQQAADRAAARLYEAPAAARMAS